MEVWERSTQPEPGSDLEDWTLEEHMGKRKGSTQVRL